MFFPQTYQLYATTLAEDAVVVVRGRLDRREDVPKLVAWSSPSRPVGGAARPGRHLAADRALHPPVVERLKEVLATHRRHRGAPAAAGASRTTVLRIDDGLRVNPSPALMGRPQGPARPACLG
jgi:DNA polymerase-3 subunit alpha